MNLPKTEKGLLSAAKSARLKGDRAFIMLGVYLARMKVQGWITDERLDEIGISYKRSTYLIRISKFTLDTDYDIGEAAKLGISKMKLIVSQATQASIGEWVEIAEDITCKELTEKLHVCEDNSGSVEAVKMHVLHAPPLSDDVNKFSVPLGREQYARLIEILVEAGYTVDLGRGDALMRVAEGWAAMQEVAAA
jgi:hypothetical protein